MPETKTYKVARTLGIEEWTGNYGPMKTYHLGLEDGTEVDLNQKPETPAPTVGQEILGHLEESDNWPRPKLKKDTQWKGGGGGGGSDEGPMIHRQVALKILAPTINEQGGLTDSIRDSCKEIEQFIGEAEAGETTTSSASNGNPAAESATLIAEIRALLEAELDASGTEAVTAHVATAMNAEEWRTVLDRLRREQTREAAIKRLVERTEEASGERIPVDDDVPF